MSIYKDALNKEFKDDYSVMTFFEKGKSFFSEDELNTVDILFIKKINHDFILKLMLDENVSEFAKICILHKTINLTVDINNFYKKEELEKIPENILLLWFKHLTCSMLNLKISDIDFEKPLIYSVPTVNFDDLFFNLCEISFISKYIDEDFINNFFKYISFDFLKNNNKNLHILNFVKDERFSYGIKSGFKLLLNSKIEDTFLLCNYEMIVNRFFYDFKEHKGMASFLNDANNLIDIFNETKDKDNETIDFLFVMLEFLFYTAIKKGYYIKKEIITILLEFKLKIALKDNYLKRNDIELYNNVSYFDLIDELYIDEEYIVSFVLTSIKSKRMIQKSSSLFYLFLSVDDMFKLKTKDKKRILEKKIELFKNNNFSDTDNDCFFSSLFHHEDYLDIVVFFPNIDFNKDKNLILSIYWNIINKRDFRLKDKWKSILSFYFLT